MVNVEEVRVRSYLIVEFYESLHPHQVIERILADSLAGRHLRQGVSVKPAPNGIFNGVGSGSAPDRPNATVLSRGS